MKIWIAFFSFALLPSCVAPSSESRASRAGDDASTPDIPNDSSPGSGGGPGSFSTSGGTSSLGGAPLEASSGGQEASSGGQEASSGGAGSSLDEGAPDPIGDGFVEYFPDFTYHVPPNAEEYGERYSYEDGVFHLWVEDTDLSTFPGNDSGPRSEVRVKNEYVSGSRQFQADVMIVAGAEKVGVWQLFQRPYPWMIRIYDGEFRQFGNGATFGDLQFGVWFRFHTIHHVASRNLKVYIDGQLVLDTTISESDGTVDFYNKFGVYGREGMGQLNEIYFKNVHYFKKD